LKKLSPAGATAAGVTVAEGGVLVPPAQVKNVLLLLPLMFLGPPPGEKRTGEKKTGDRPLRTFFGKRKTITMDIVWIQGHRRTFFFQR
jgi:hypothetical protein